MCQHKQAIPVSISFNVLLFTLHFIAVEPNIRNLCDCNFFFLMKGIKDLVVGIALLFSHHFHQNVVKPEKK